MVVLGSIYIHVRPIGRFLRPTPWERARILGAPTLHYSFIKALYTDEELGAGAVSAVLER
eukprot:COSAG01_NODE_5691_length_4095_cov_33.484985_4_plen_59_part_01